MGFKFGVSCMYIVSLYIYKNTKGCRVVFLMAAVPGTRRSTHQWPLETAVRRRSWRPSSDPELFSHGRRHQKSAGFGKKEKHLESSHWKTLENWNSNPLWMIFLLNRLIFNIRCLFARWCTYNGIFWMLSQQVQMKMNFSFRFYIDGSTFGRCHQNWGYDTRCFKVWDSSNQL